MRLVTFTANVVLEIEPGQDPYEELSMYLSGDDPSEMFNIADDVEVSDDLA